jgi:hypothetical protein
VELGTTAHLDRSDDSSVVEPAHLEHHPVITSKSNLSTIGATILLASLAPACIDVPDSSEESSELRVASVKLGTAGNFVILTKTGVASVPPSVIMGNIGVSPIAATAITGLALTMDPTNVFSTSQQVIGKVFAADYASPTPANLTTAVGDMELAFTDAAGRAPSVTELGAGNIGGKTLAPGVYKWGTGLLIPTNVTLTGGSTDVWIFEVAQDLSLSSAANVVLKGGARPENIFWQVSGGVTLGSTAHLEGIVLSKTAITLGAKASVHGRLLSQTAVTLINNTIVQPSP